MSESITFKVAKYKPGSYIMIEGDKIPEEFYIIQSGRVQVFETIDPIIRGSKDGVSLNKGDFFGVVSCMSKRSNMETVVSLEDTSLLCIHRSQFGDLIQKSAPIAVKILRFFSQKLREYDTTLTKLTFKSHTEEDPYQLFNIAEFYYSKKMQEQAAYAYKKYIEYCPDGGYVSVAKMKLASIDPIIAMAEPDIDPQKSIERYHDNQVVFCEHEYGDKAYVILKGNVRITKFVNGNEVLLAVLKEGDIFGEMSILENKPRSATATAVGETELMYVKRENFEAMVHTRPEIATRIIELLSDRIWAIYRQLANIALKEANARIYDAIMIQIEKNRITIKPKESYKLNFSVEDLIKFLGYNIDEGKKYIKSILDSDKNISISADGKIVVNDLDKLLKDVTFYKKKLLMDLKIQLSRLQQNKQ
ncbi:MAG: cyclic nucleotide-binding domain-containing protein [Spirochaetia bacterium]|nr:cyclic nucleotide-binding domain-containing protein [Spirochaetota bacterium]MCX8096468.1 cyclic nucleotide-binding domain-containing protein [Spirochaetota bacterium]MDW8112728.1 cyclic nucleotide-binding domain-containing protein [Spirochaetia bacterium]